MSTLAKINSVTGRGVPVLGQDIDTDQIIPARYLKCVTFDGLGEFAFYDARYDAEGNTQGHPLDKPEFAGASILITGANFGCGSSREHAPQALKKFGIQGIIGQSFAEIFFGNATAIGIPCVSLSASDIETLAAYVQQNPKAEITLDLDAKVVTVDAQQFPLEIKEGARESLRNGQWDPLAIMLDKPEQIDAVANRLAYVQAGK